MPSFSAFCLTLCLLSSAPIFAVGQNLPACNDAHVTYSPSPKDVEHRIHLLTPASPEAPPATGSRVQSVQGTRWFVEVDPDYTQTVRPWTTTLYLGRSNSQKAVLIASFQDHGNTFTANWINEDLLFIQVWWGRIASSDLILDVSSGRFLYDRLANYGQTIQPCRSEK